MQARIYKPARTAMQSGEAGTKHWILEFEHDGSRFIEPLMGWTGSYDMNQEVELKFSSKEEAIRFAENHAIPYVIEEPSAQKHKSKSYANNFTRPVSL